MVKSLLFISLLFSSTSDQNAPNEQASEDLQKSIQAVLSSSGLSGSTTSLIIKEPGAAQPLFSHNPDALLVPASTIKIFTTAVALDVLGPDYRFVTELRGSPNHNHSRIEGDLCLKGYGDPWLIPERLWHLTQRLKATGIRSITGNVVVDSTYFAGSQHANGIEQDDSSSAYMAPAGAVSVGFNVIQIHVRPNSKAGQPAIIYTEPASDHIVVEGAITTTSNGVSRYDVEVVPREGKSVVTLSGNISMKEKPRRWWRRITGPSLHAGSALHKLLLETGISLEGEVTTGSCSEDSVVVADTQSPRLADLISKVNKYSNNFMASQLARSVGAHIYGAPGTWAKGQKALQRFLTEQVGIAAKSFQIENASGLHNVNRISTAHVAKLLEYLYSRPRLRTEFINSLAVSGGTGTLEDRMENSVAYGVVRAKTGTLSIASALSGYISNSTGKPLIFSMITNNYKRGITTVLEAQNEIGRLLASSQALALAPRDTQALGDTTKTTNN